QKTRHRPGPSRPSRCAYDDDADRWLLVADQPRYRRSDGYGARLDQPGELSAGRGPRRVDRGDGDREPTHLGARTADQTGTRIDGKAEGQSAGGPGVRRGPAGGAELRLAGGVLPRRLVAGVGHDQRRGRRSAADVDRVADLVVRDRRWVEVEAGQGR